MEILKLSLEWAKAEVFSTKFFILFAIVFIAASIGFWQFGKTELAKAYIFPLLIAGILLLTVGVGLFYNNTTRIKNFPIAHKADAAAFTASELERCEATMAQFTNHVLKIIPILIAVAAILFVLVNKPIVRASCVATISMLCILLLIDGNSNARMEKYYEAIKSEQQCQE